MKMVDKKKIIRLLSALLFASVSTAHAIPPVFEPVDVNVLNTPGVVIENSPSVVIENSPGVMIENTKAAPVPVEVQEDAHDILHGQVDLSVKGSDALDPLPIAWERLDGTFFGEIPEGHILFITDIVVSWFDDFSTPTADAPFVLVFARMAENGSVARLMDLSGTGLPYSHSFATPLFFAALTGSGNRLGITRLSNDRVMVTLTGYLAPAGE